MKGKEGEFKVLTCLKFVQMKKYFRVFQITLQEHFVYRLNFILWRFRSALQLLVLYFLWQAAIPSGVTVFGYDQARILTYILGTSIIRSFVLSSRSIDAAGQIANGELSNFLIKPISYLKYWLAKDLSDKTLNLIFSVFEIGIIILILKPPLIIQENLAFLALSLVAVVFAITLYFYLSFLLSLVAFWTPEAPWRARFLFMIILEFFAGGLFPLDILPGTLFNILKISPFSYLLFFPLHVYLGQLPPGEVFLGLGICLFWIVITFFLTRKLFNAGLRNYAAWGR